MQQLMTNLFDYLLLWTIKHSMLDRPINVGTNPLFTVIVKQTVRGSREVEKQKTELLNKGIFNELVCVKLCVEWWSLWSGFKLFSAHPQADYCTYAMVIFKPCKIKAFTNFWWKFCTQNLKVTNKKFIVVMVTTNYNLLHNKAVSLKLCLKSHSSISTQLC